MHVLARRAQAAFGAGGGAAAPFIELRHVRKAFPGTVALAGVQFDVRRGEVHALVGENGAGKSTLVNIIAGIHTDYDGEMLVEGTPTRFANPRQAASYGISLIQQELSLVPEMSVSENIFLGREPSARLPGFVDFRALDRRASALLEELGVRLPVREPVSRLGPAQRQLVEIAKGLSSEPKLLILDEPTSSLAQAETAHLFALIRALRDGGASVVYISHRLDEVFAISDRATVLRDGELMATRPIGQWDEAGLVRAMVGRDLSRLYAKSAAVGQDEVLRVAGLGVDGLFDDISFAIRRGEVLGLAGLIGAGRSEIAEAIFGLVPAQRGAIFLEGHPISIRTPADAIHHGIGLVPEDRRLRGLISTLSVGRNVSLPSLRRLCRGPFVRRRLEHAEVERVTTSVGVTAGRLETEVRTLSGGNQQKVVVAKWLLRSPRILILDEPTRGIDVGAKAEIYALIDRLAVGGMAILMISSELPEILGMSDRILVVRSGRIVGELNRADASEEAIIALATGTSSRGVAA